MEHEVRRFLQIALVCIIPFTLGGFHWIQTSNVDADAIARLSSIERGVVQSGAEPPHFDVSKRFKTSFPRAPTKSGHILNRTVHGDLSQWPEMKYLNEEFVLDDSRITISDYRIVTGGSIPKAYLPETGEMYDAPDGGRRWERWGSPAVVIPPKASLVMARVDVNPPMHGEDGCINPFTGQVSELREDYLLLAYPRVGEITPLRTLYPGEVEYGPFNQPQSGCFGNGWYYFFVPTLNPDNSKAWITYNDDNDPELQAFWTLAERP